MDYKRSLAVVDAILSNPAKQRLMVSHLSFDGPRDCSTSWPSLPSITCICRVAPPLTEARGDCCVVTVLALSTSCLTHRFQPPVC